MTRIEEANARIVKAQAVYVEACQKLQNLIAAERKKADDQIKAIEDRKKLAIEKLENLAQQQKDKVNASLEPLSTPEIREHQFDAVNAERKQMGLPPVSRAVAQCA